MNIEEKLVDLLKGKKEKISTAESCTGGLVAGRIINVSGASYVFDEGYVTYANSSKMKLLGVGEDTLNRMGAVSKECAEQMAKGCANFANANMGISTTGIAGPDGGTEEKPVGTVFIGCYYNGITHVKKCLFEGERLQVREQAVDAVLQFAIDILTLEN